MIMLPFHKHSFHYQHVESSSQSTLLNVFDKILGILFITCINVSMFVTIFIFGDIKSNGKRSMDNFYFHMEIVENMKIYKSISIFLLVSFAQAQSDLSDWPCDSGWEAFKDEKCFKALDITNRTYDEAVNDCALEDDTATLSIITSKEEQDFLENYLFKTLSKRENFWIGAKFVNGSSSSSFYWNDGTSLSYTNWNLGRPLNEPNYCVIVKSDAALLGKWFDQQCNERNSVVCQKMRLWTIDYLQKTILRERRELSDLKRELYETNKQIHGLKQSLESEKTSNRNIIANLKKVLEDESYKNLTNLKQNLIPIGFIYAQLPYEKPPREIWPSMSWTDVSATYAGVFFRVNGAGSESFGQTQAENSQKLVIVESTIDKQNLKQKQILDNECSNTKSTDWIWTGSDAKEIWNQVHLRFTVTTGENRPRNMAIRIWKRTN